MNLITASRLRRLRDCLRRHRWEYVDQFRASPTEAMRFGSAWHRALEGQPVEDPIVSAMLPGYRDRWASEPVPERREVAFEVPLIHPDGREHPTWRLAGKIDGIAGSSIVEHKTASQIDEDYWAALTLDPQVSIYFLGAMSLGIDVDRCVYDVLRKPSIRRKQTETQEEYYARLAADCLARPDFYFHRRAVYRDLAQIRSLLGDLWDWVSIAEGPSPPNPDACHRFGTCPFWTCCSTGSAPADHPSLYARLQTAHPEIDAR
jgi:hypothetical protein